jgi:hypothetical protein
MAKVRDSHLYGLRNRILHLVAEDRHAAMLRVGADVLSGLAGSRYDQAAARRGLVPYLPEGAADLDLADPRIATALEFGWKAGYRQGSDRALFHADAVLIGADLRRQLAITDRRTA